MEKVVHLKGGKVCEVGDQRLPGVHRQTYEYPDKGEYGFDDVIQVRNSTPTWKKISTWMRKIDRAEGSKSVEEFVEELVAIASSDTLEFKLYGADQESKLFHSP